MIAIQTKYCSPTNSRGSRIKAWTSNGHVVYVPFMHELSHEMLYFQAAKALVEKYKLDWDLTNARYGGTESGYVFCFANAIVNEETLAA
jgi:hypothetical protein